MKYYEVVFTLSPCSQDAQDLLSALAGEAGFETFEETADGLLGYVQQQQFDQAVLDQVIAGFPMDTQIAYEVRQAEDKDWNEQWEQEGFEPIVIGGAKSDEDEGRSAIRAKSDEDEGRSAMIVIHDGRHLPDESSLPHPAAAVLHNIEIDARLAFGTGTHETTRMICSTLLQLDLKGLNVLDCGCGTGILGICALKLGAARCVGYDIDEWSTDNTRHNAVINQVDNRLTALNGDAALLDSLTERFQIVMANINRNILLQDMPRFVSVMAPGGTLILSGFYTGDCPLLEAKASELGLTLSDIRHDGEWACMVMREM